MKLVEGTQNYYECENCGYRMHGTRELRDQHERDCNDSGRYNHPTRSDADTEPARDDADDEEAR